MTMGTMGLTMATAMGRASASVSEEAVVTTATTAGGSEVSRVWRIRVGWAVCRDQYDVRPASFPAGLEPLFGALAAIV